MNGWRATSDLLLLTPVHVHILGSGIKGTFFDPSKLNYKFARAILIVFIATILIHFLL
jgi:hypothetical protein